MPASLKLKELNQEVSELFETLWAMTLRKDLPLSQIAAPALAGTIMGIVEFKVLKLQPLGREVELAWEDVILERVLIGNDR
jgi:hypothetical protein